MSAKASTSTPWRNDEANIEVVRELNRAWEHYTFSKEYEGVLDDPPFRIEWTTGPNVLVVWKGGASGAIGDDIVLAGGLWMPEYQNLAYAFDTVTQTYTELPPPPHPTEYSQGACDGESLYLVSGRVGGSNVQKLSKTADGDWEWSLLPPVPVPGKGMAFAAVGVIPDEWLFLAAGLPHATVDERNDCRLRLDDPSAECEAIPACPVNPRHLVSATAANGEFYVFGGAR
jgi:hypothetical protein